MLPVNNVALRIIDKLEGTKANLYSEKESVSLHDFCSKILNNEEKQEIVGLVETINYELRQSVESHKNFNTLFQPMSVGGGTQALGMITDEKTIVLYFLADMGVHIRVKDLVELNKEEKINSYKNILNNTLLGLKDLDYFNKLQLITHLDKDLSVNETLKPKIKL